MEKKQVGCCYEMRRRICVFRALNSSKIRSLFSPYSLFPHEKETSRLRYEMRRRMCVLRTLNSSKYATYFPTTHRSHMEKKMLLGYTLTFPRREKIVQNGRNAPDDVLRVLQAVRLVFIFSLPIVPTWKRSK